IELKKPTVNHKERIIDEFVGHFGEKDIRTFNEKVAIDYKELLLKKTFRGNPILKKTVNNMLATIRDFLVWITQQPGYRTNFNHSHILYLNLGRAVTRAIESSEEIKRIPSLEYVKSLIKSIDGKSEVDYRDRALIALTLLGGFRGGTLTSIRIKDINLADLTVTLDTLDFASMKGDASNVVRLLVFKVWLLEPVKFWLKYLVDELKYKTKDPFFPMTDVYANRDHFTAEKVKPNFWKNTSAINGIFKDRAMSADLPYFHPHSFRRLNYTLARKYCTTMEELAAVSRNLGHVHIDTSDGYYGNIQLDTRLEILSEMDFSQEPDQRRDNYDLNELADLIAEKINKQKETT
ncbi:MAG: tyrosine-type recombinase/integrase, partial [Actinobacteria bacterium]|nr:tyrosine-type recombinase/integrase [Actinomycetota bacterium]